MSPMTDDASPSGSSGKPTQGRQTLGRLAMKVSATLSTVAPSTLSACSIAFISATGICARVK